MTGAPEPGASLSGRVVLVTGGSRGIGAEAARQAARAGAAVAVGYLSSAESASAVVEEIRTGGGTADAFPADVGDQAAVRSLVAEVERRLGPIDGLVNSAGVMGNGQFLELGEAEWEQIVRGDLYSVVFAAQAVLPGMLERGRGSIVNLSSRLAHVPAVDAVPYAAAKAAVISLTRSLAEAYGERGVRVNAVSPGTVSTDMGRAMIESATGRERVGRIPIRRFVEASEVAAAVVFLLSDASAAFTGQTLHANGGEWMA